MDLTEQIRAFIATAQTGSFTAAGHRLGISNRLTSKYVAELEVRLGTRLMQRTTRKIGLTPAGERLLARGPALIEGLDDLLDEVSEQSRGYSGTIRVSAPVTFGEMFVADTLARFAAPHPDLTVDLHLSDTFVDLAAGGIDLAFRIGQLGDSALKARRVGHFAMRMVAAPAYIDARGTPRDLGDLTSHDCIFDTNHRKVQKWRVGAQDAPHDIAIQARFMVNSGRVARDMAIAGKGIAYCPQFMVETALADGRLTGVLPDQPFPVTDLHLVYLDGVALSRKLRALMDFSIAQMRAELTSLG
ncbi:LysR family transcriptional regulator [Rhodobacteraceae bacterium]|nr:LysR family transcriptional regulator [Paracoccaceae bacterium]